MYIRNPTALKKESKLKLLLFFYYFFSISKMGKFSASRDPSKILLLLLRTYEWPIHTRVFIAVAESGTATTSRLPQDERCVGQPASSCARDVSSTHEETSPTTGLLGSRGGCREEYCHKLTTADQERGILLLNKAVGSRIVSSEMAVGAVLAAAREAEMDTKRVHGVNEVLQGDMTEADLEDAEASGMNRIFLQDDDVERMHIRCNAKAGESITEAPEDSASDLAIQSDTVTNSLNFVDKLFGSNKARNGEHFASSNHFADERNQGIVAHTEGSGSCLAETSVGPEIEAEAAAFEIVLQTQLSPQVRFSQYRQSKNRGHV
jgi:hypothetical protein